MSDALHVLLKVTGLWAVPCITARWERDCFRSSKPISVIEVGMPYELLLIPPGPIASLKGVLRRQRFRADGSPDGSPRDVGKIGYEDVPMSALRLAMPPMALCGWFEVQFVGTPTNSEPVRVAVADPESKGNPHPGKERGSATKVSEKAHGRDHGPAGS
jgi:hypothetical protein